MKTATCKQLQGVCDTAITAQKPKDMLLSYQRHVQEKVKTGDNKHAELMQTFKAMSMFEKLDLYKEFLELFETLPETS